MEQTTNKALLHWYQHYLMEYVQIVTQPKYSQEEQIKYNDILLRWLANFNQNEEMENE